MEKDISEGEFAENDFFKYCIVYVIIFCFLLVWSDTPKENFVGIFSVSLPLVTEQCFLQKKSRWFACSAMDRTFSHDALEQTRENRRLSYFKGNSKKITSPPAF